MPKKMLEAGENAESSISTHVRPSFFTCVFGSKGVFRDFQGQHGITSIAQWNLRPVKFVVDFGA